MKQMTNVQRSIYAQVESLQEDEKEKEKKKEREIRYTLKWSSWRHPQQSQLTENHPGST